jgi:hypothetical protein
MTSSFLTAEDKGHSYSLCFWPGQRLILTPWRPQEGDREIFMVIVISVFWISSLVFLMYRQYQKSTTRSWARLKENFKRFGPLSDSNWWLPYGFLTLRIVAGRIHSKFERNYHTFQKLEGRFRNRELFSTAISKYEGLFEKHSIGMRWKMILGIRCLRAMQVFS